MRVTKYVKSDGENWIVVRIRCSAHVSYDKLDRIMRANGWIHWSGVRDRFNVLKKRIQKSNPAKYANWKEIKIEMKNGKRSDLPAVVANESQIHLVDAANEAVDPMKEDIPFTDADAKAMIAYQPVETAAVEKPAAAPIPAKSKNSLAGFAAKLGAKNGN